MVILEMFKNKRYVFLSVVLTLAMLVLYPLLQVLPQGGLHNFWFWFSVPSLYQLLLYVSYAVLFGLTVSFFFYSRKVKVCPTSRQVRSGIPGVLGAAMGFVLPVCPACISLAAFLMPISAFTFIAGHSTQFLLASVFLLAISLWTLGAFRINSAQISL